MEAGMIGMFIGLFIAIAGLVLVVAGFITDISMGLTMPKRKRTTIIVIALGMAALGVVIAAISMLVSISGMG